MHDIMVADRQSQAGVLSSSLSELQRALHLLGEFDLSDYKFVSSTFGSCFADIPGKERIEASRWQSIRCGASRALLRLVRSNAGPRKTGTLVDLTRMAGVS
jgi:hypothetical protein